MAIVIGVSGCQPPPPPMDHGEKIDVAPTKGIVTLPRNTTGGPGFLSAFFFKFSYDDHPLQTIAVHPTGSTIEVAFADRDPRAGDDEYFGTIIYQYIDDPGIVEKSASLPICISNCPLNDTQLQDCESRG